MDPIKKAMWVADLRSGDYEQGQGFLCREGKFCCLGVLADQAVRAGVIPQPEEELVLYYDGEPKLLTTAVRRWAKVPTYVQVLAGGGGCSHWYFGRHETLASLNDAGFTFDQIADIIEWSL